LKFVYYTKFKGLESTANGMISALEELGHEVKVVNTQNYAPRGHSEAAFQECVKHSENADTVILTKGTWLPKNRLQWLVGQRDVTMFTPDSVSVGPPNRPDELGTRALMTHRVICTGTEGARWLRQNGYKKRIAQIYQGHRPEFWQRKEKVKVNTQLVFLGSLYRNDGNRKAKLHEIKTAGFSLHYHRKTFLEKAASLYYSTPISINFNCGDITSNRVLRILASGGFCLTQANADIKHTFTNEKELVWWDEPFGEKINAKAMLDAIRCWVDNPKERQRIAETGHEWAKDKSWLNQMEKHVRFIKGEDIPADGAAGAFVGTCDETATD
jgi:hypothetical protein